MRSLAIVLAGLLLLSIANSAPAQSPEHVLALWRQTTIYRDEWGVPHIHADNHRAMAFGFGYAQAEDHLAPMALAYRIAAGRASEVFGETYAEQDALSLQLGHLELAGRAYSRIDPLTRDLCEGFALGVNAWMADFPSRVPDWVERVTPEDILALWHSFTLSQAPFDVYGRNERMAEPGTGNAWAVGPSRSETGDPLLVINPHTDYFGPFQWYEAHVATPEMNVAGATLFGLPVIIQGHNASLGWALSPNRADTADVFVHRGLLSGLPRDTRDDSPVTAAQALALELAPHVRTYYVWTPNGMEQRETLRIQTSTGPVIHREGNLFFSLEAGAYGDFGGLSQLVAMGAAHDHAAFSAAMSRQHLPNSHVLYADRAGNIAYVYSTRTGARQSVNADPLTTLRMTPLPADRHELRWGAIVPLAAMPSLANPEAGYLQACGTPPWGVTDDTGLDPGNWPDWLVQDYDTFRARRVRHLLGMGKVSFHDTQSMLYDVLTPFALEAAPVLVNMVENMPGYPDNVHSDLAVAADILRRWDHVASVDSVGMTLFHTWWEMFQLNADPRLGDEENLKWAVISGVPEIQESMVASLIDAARMLRNDHGSLQVPWGDAHRVTRGHRDEPIGGGMSGDPVFVTGDKVYDAGVWRATYGYGFAMVVRFGEVVEAASVVPFGASTNPSSPHFDDQMDLVLQKRLKRTRFLDSDVERNAERALGSIVSLRPRESDARFTLRAEMPFEVRLNTNRTPPMPLPEGLAAFTGFFSVEHAPPALPLEADMAIPLDPEVCRPADWHRLALFTLDAGRGWQVGPEQTVDLESGLLLARDIGPRVYAVLGPADRLVRRAVDPGVRRQLPSRGEAARAGDTEVSEYETAGRPVQTARIPDEGMPRRPAEVPEPSDPVPQPVRQPEMPVPDTPPPRDPLPTRTAERFRHGDSYRDDSSAPMLTSDELEAFRQEADRPHRADRGRVVLGVRSERYLRPASERPAPTEAEKAIAPPKRTDFVVSPPWLEAVFDVSADRPVALNVTGPPESLPGLPEGVVPFSGFVTFETDPADSTLLVGVSIRPTPGLCAPGDLDTLRIYGYGEAQGWTFLEGQFLDTTEYAFKGAGEGFRAFVLAGPESSRVRPESQSQGAPPAR